MGSYVKMADGSMGYAPDGVLDGYADNVKGMAKLIGMIDTRDWMTIIGEKTDNLEEAKRMIDVIILAQGLRRR